MHNLVIDILKKLNHPEEHVDTIHSIIKLIKNYKNFDAVGIRLKEGDDYPYYYSKGFSEDFIKKETYLCSRDRNDQIIREPDGRACLECMCGNILRGRINPSLHFFTKGGSFWSNETSKLIASTTEEDRQSRTRNRCNSTGYESVALIPLTSNNEIVGLIQINDKKTNMFTLEQIEFFEDVGTSIGIALLRKQIEGKLVKAKEDAEVANNLKSALLAMVSHDIRSPLNTILGFTDLLADSELDAEQKESVNIISSASNNILNLSGNVLDFVKMGKNIFELDSKEFNIRDTIEKNNETIFTPSSCNIFSTHIDANVPNFIIGDPIRLCQILSNLIGNANKFTKNGKVSLEIKVNNELSNTKDKIELLFYVEDTGMGIPKNKIDKIFDMFTQADKSIYSEYGGTGLGLFICKKIAELMGGKIWVESKKNIGSKFCFTLEFEVLHNP